MRRLRHTLLALALGLGALAGMAPAAEPLAAPAAVTAPAPRLLAGPDLYAQVLPAIGFIRSEYDEATGTGTGWVVDRESRLMVTNHHVVHHLGRRANQIRVCFPVRDEQNEIIAEAAHYRRTVLKSGIKARVVFTSPERDLALLQLDRLPQGTNALPLAATSIRPGEAVASVGNPARSEACWVFNSGTVRQIYRRTFRANKQNIAARMVETQQPIASGDSGSPMLNFKGEVVGVISSTKEDAPLFNYGIDLTELRAFLEQAGTGDQASAPDRTDSENSGRGDKYGSRPRSFSGIARAADGND